MLMFMRVAKIRCRTCSGEWYATWDKFDIKACPYCSAPMGTEHSKGIPECGTMGEALYYAVKQMGEDAFDDPVKLVAIMTDIAPAMRKEVKIFSKMLDGKVPRLLKSIFFPDEGADTGDIKKLHIVLTTEEGLPGEWADFLCGAVQEALTFDEKPRVANADISDTWLIKDQFYKPGSANAGHLYSLAGYYERQACCAEDKNEATEDLNTAIAYCERAAKEGHAGARAKLKVLNAYRAR